VSAVFFRCLGGRGAFTARFFAYVCWVKRGDLHIFPDAQGAACINIYAIQRVVVFFSLSGLGYDVHADVVPLALVEERATSIPA
jgi:hypothetical protein